MKMKSIFLSMLAIAVLASCSKEELNLSPPGPQEPQGEKVMLTLNFAGAATTKVSGAATDAADKAIQDVNVFVLNATGVIIHKAYQDGLGTGTEAKSVTIETTNSAHSVIVIANLGENQIGAGGDLNVLSRTDLETKTQSLLNATAPFQSAGHVIMTGEADITGMPSVPGGAGTPQADVQMYFIGAKIKLTQMIGHADLKGEYGTTFKFSRAYLKNVQTNSYYLPRTTGTPPSDYITGITTAYASGINVATQTEVSDFLEDLSGHSSFGPTTSNPINNVGYWYVFEDNKGVDEASTRLIIEMLWKKTSGEGMTTKKYFNVIFADGDIEAIKAGKVYDVKLTFKGNFNSEDDSTDPGDGGGGSDDDDTPNVKVSLGVTVTPSEWADRPTNKPF